jgi:hypothetical protein
MSGTTTEGNFNRVAGVVIAGCLLMACEPPEHEPARSALHACVVSTAITVPARFSLCQLKNNDDHRVGVYRIGDIFMGARILSIANGRVLIGDPEHFQSIGNCASEPSPATVQPVWDGPLPVLEATSPQG